MENPGRELEMQKMVTIDGEDYKLHCFGPTRAITLGVRLNKMILEPIVGMSGAAGDESKLSETLMTCARTLTKNMDASETVGIIKELINCVTYQNKSINFETHFMGRLGHLSKVVGEVVRFQFSDFTSAIGQVFRDLIANKKLV